MSETSNKQAPPKMTALDGGAEEGITWATVTAPLWGAVNGYVHIPEDHLLRDLDYDEMQDRLDLSDLLGGAGELTFSRDGWIGFDTLHGCDYWPGCPEHWKADWAVHWTAEMVAEQARLLARKIAEATR